MAKITVKSVPNCLNMPTKIVFVEKMRRATIEKTRWQVNDLNKLPHAIILASLYF